MTTINLYQNQQEEQQKNYSRVFNSGLFFSLGILAITLLALVGLKVAVSLLTDQNKSLADTIQKEKDSMAGLSSLEQVVDIQTRLKYIKSNLQIDENNKMSRIQMTQVLYNMENNTNLGIVISSYKYENDIDKITLTFEANNFNDAARQIVSFKESPYFTNVNLAGISRGEKAILCDITMYVKNVKQQ